MTGEHLFTLHERNLLSIVDLPIFWGIHLLAKNVQLSVSEKRGKSAWRTGFGYDLSFFTVAILRPVLRKQGCKPEHAARGRHEVLLVWLVHSGFNTTLLEQVSEGTVSSSADRPSPPSSRLHDAKL